MVDRENVHLNSQIKQLSLNNRYEQKRNGTQGCHSFCELKIEEIQGGMATLIL